MKTKYFISFVIVSLALIGSVILINKIFAQGTTETQNIQYPVKELGNCKDESSCKSYCDKPENANSCVNFAEKNNLMSKEEIEMAKKFMAVGSKGPGGCRGKNECDTYCNDMANINECVAFAEKNNLMSPKELEEAKMVQAAIKRGVKPPPCNGKEACDTYCEDPNRMEECIAFGAEAGFIQGKELEDAQKMLAAIKKGVKLLPCKGKEACDAYCGDLNNIETCMNFAMEVGFMNEQEKADSQKMLQALKKGVKPPPCNGKEACDAYCSQNFDECTKFAEAAGFMTPEEAAMARKTGGKGPDGCKNKEECDAFCGNPDNQETCLNFAKDNGMIPEADLKQMEEGKQKFQETLQQAPSAVLDCFNSEIGTDTMEKFKSGKAMPPREIGDKMRRCFEKMDSSEPGNKGEPGAGGMIPPAGQTGPGQKFQPAPGSTNPGGQTLPQQAGPGGCKGPEECQAYCKSNPDECQNFQPKQGEGAPPQGQPGQMPAPGTQPNMPLLPQENREGMMPKEGETGPNVLPPSTAPGTSGGLTPGVFVPLAPPTEPTAPPPSGEPVPAPEPAPAPSSLLQYSPFGVILNFFLGQ